MYNGLTRRPNARQVVEFSPCETYVMTCNFEQGDKAIIVWEVLTGQMLRAFPMATTAAAGVKRKYVDIAQEHPYFMCVILQDFTS